MVVRRARRGNGGTRGCRRCVVNKKGSGRSMPNSGGSVRPIDIPLIATVVIDSANAVIDEI